VNTIGECLASHYYVSDPCDVWPIFTNVAGPRSSQRHGW